MLADTYGPALPSVLAERPAIVKVNADEAGEATDVVVTDPESAEAAAVVLVRQGATCVVVTLGRGGAVVVTATRALRLVAPEIRGRYSVGSGDAFLGGLAVGLWQGEETIEAARLGLAAGIANALVPGAGNLDPASIGQILASISVVGSR